MKRVATDYLVGRRKNRKRHIAEISPPVPAANATEAARARLRGSLVRCETPLEPVLPAEEWESNR